MFSVRPPLAFGVSRVETRLFSCDSEEIQIDPVFGGFPGLTEVWTDRICDGAFVLDLVVKDRPLEGNLLVFGDGRQGDVISGR